MKMMSFAIFAMSGLLASSLAFAAPSIKTVADDASDSGSQMQSPTDGMPNVSGSMQDDSSSGSSQGDMMNNDQGSATGVGGADEGSPDTATGDDDY